MLNILVRMIRCWCYWTTWWIQLFPEPVASLCMNISTHIATIILILILIIIIAYTCHELYCARVKNYAYQHYEKYVFLFILSPFFYFTSSKIFFIELNEPINELASYGTIISLSFLPLVNSGSTLIYCIAIMYGSGSPCGIDF